MRAGAKLCWEVDLDSCLIDLTEPDTNEDLIQMKSGGRSLKY